MIYFLEHPNYRDIESIVYNLIKDPFLMTSHYSILNCVMRISKMHHRTHLTWRTLCSSVIHLSRFLTLQYFFKDQELLNIWFPLVKTFIWYLTWLCTTSVFRFDCELHIYFLYHLDLCCGALPLRVYIRLLRLL